MRQRVRTLETLPVCTVETYTKIFNAGLFLKVKKLETKCHPQENGKIAAYSHNEILLK